MARSPRKLSQTLSEEQYQKLSEHIPYGDRRRVFNVLIEGLIELLEGANGPYVLGAILSRKLKVSTIIDAAQHDGQRNKTSRTEAVD